jgi:hypothetical protein
MTLPGLVAARNLADVTDRERAWDNIGNNIFSELPIPGNFDSDAATYIANVEIADNSALEPFVRSAINTFIVGCKSDGIWPAIKASCILAGARTLAGALVPLVGTAPTNFNFVSGDYNRKTGLAGNGSTKYLDSNRASNADPNTNFHCATYRFAKTGGRILGANIGNTDTGNETVGFYSVGSPDAFNFRIRGSNFLAAPDVVGFLGATIQTQRTARIGGINFTQAGGAVAPTSNNIIVFGRSLENGTITDQSPARLSFYSIGEGLNLALLDARVTTLIGAFAAIP